MVVAAVPAVASAVKAAMAANKLRAGAQAAGVTPGSVMNVASMAAKMKGMKTGANNWKNAPAKQSTLLTALGMDVANPTKGSNMMMYIAVFLALAITVLAFMFGTKTGPFKKTFDSRRLGPRVSRPVPEQRNYGEHREFMFGKKSSRQNNYNVEKSATTGPGAQTSTDLGGFFGMRAPGAVLGQRPIGAPIKPPATGSTRSLRLNKQPATGEIRRGSDGIPIDANEGVEEELMKQAEAEEMAQMRDEQAERRSARSNKVLNNTGHSEQISEIVASTTLSSGNDFKGMFGRNSARYSNRDVQSRYIEPVLKQEKPNMH
tara:strand:- start:10328 stop:11278 length:951 start_codon:yes stop_codon:yes gene_type:complete